jgi:hypothetical protein
MSQGFARQQVLTAPAQPARTDYLGETAVLADDASDDTLDADVGGLAGLILGIQTDYAARVRLYATAAARTADLSRAIGAPPDEGLGLVCEVITTAEVLSVPLSPAAPFANLEDPPAATLPMTVTNLSGSERAINVAVTALPLEQ